MRFKKYPIPKKTNPYKGARLGRGWYEDHIRYSRITNANLSEHQCIPK